MKPPPFHYFDPRSVEEACDLLATKENARLLAGGQSLMPMLNMRYVQPDNIIDLNRVAGLDGIREDGTSLCIGAMARQRDLEFSDFVRERCPLMHEALLNVGHRQTRNRGTIGGSLCHLDPAAELPTVAAAYDATIEVKSIDGSREIPMADFPAFFMTPSIEPNEMVTGVRLTPWPKGHGSAFVEFARRHGDFAITSVAVLLDIDADRKVKRASIALGGLSHCPERATQSEALLLGNIATNRLMEEAADACGEIEAKSDVHASANYRRHLARTLAFRAINKAFERVNHAVNAS